MAEMQSLDPKMSAVRGPVALVASSYNRTIVERLLDGATTALAEAGSPALGPFWVPGALEIPLACRWIIEARQPRACVAVGCVIRGDTLHFDLVAHGSAEGLMTVSLETGVPVANAILACDTLQQADLRSQPGRGNKGYEAAAAALAMAALREKLNLS